MTQQTLNASLLREKGACKSQVKKFESEWPNGMPLDESVIPRVIELGLDIDWFAKNLLTALSLAKYKRVTAPAWAEYKRVKAPAWAEYERVTAPTWAEYIRVKATAWAEYKRVKAPALAEYEHVTALACLRLYKRQQ